MFSFLGHMKSIWSGVGRSEFHKGMSYKLQGLKEWIQANQQNVEYFIFL